MYSTMPKIDLDALREQQLTPEQVSIVRRIISGQGKNKGRLRASKPMVDRTDPLSGKAAYVWRMVAFAISPIGQHQSMPVTAEWDLPDWKDREARKVMVKELDALADKVIDSVPKGEWHGIKRWGIALGYVEREPGEL